MAACRTSPRDRGGAQPVRSNETRRTRGRLGGTPEACSACQNRRHGGIWTLYDRYLNLVYRYVYFRVGSHPLAEDLTSETFLRALRRIADFTWQGRDFGAWLVTIARNLVTDHFKSGSYRLEVPTGEVIDTPLDGPHIPENAVVTAMVSDRVLRAVRDLTPSSRSASSCVSFTACPWRRPRSSWARRVERSRRCSSVRFGRSLVRSPPISADDSLGPCPRRITMPMVRYRVTWRAKSSLGKWYR